MRVQTNYKEGDLVRFKSQSNFEQKLGLVVQVVRNRLDQPQGYQVQIGQDVQFKSFDGQEEWHHGLVLRFDHFLQVGEIITLGGIICYAPARLIRKVL